MPGGVVVCGGGLAGLAAGQALARGGRAVTVFERDAVVGGLARTREHAGQRFDLGGHRLLTDRARVHDLVSEVVREPLLKVRRSSKILLHGRWIDYPLRPLNALAGIGAVESARALSGWLAAQIAQRVRPRDLATLEQWVVRHYGRALFELFFRPYSEKVWGLSCDAVSADWVAQRIQGLTLVELLGRSLQRVARAGPRTLANDFLYPLRGIGGIAEGLRVSIEAQGGRLHTQSTVTRIAHAGRRIEHVVVRRDGRSDACHAEDFISSMPLPALVRMLRPAPPQEVLETAARLRYRDLLLVAVRIARERATDQTWIYVPGREFALGRIHEPKNWSPAMGAPGATLLVAEHFCARTDPAWQCDDATLVARCAEELTRLGLIARGDVRDGAVVRVPHAYPIFDTRYAQARAVLARYLERFANLQVIGRTGAFRYHNMDHAIEEGLEAADATLARSAPALRRTGT